MIFPNKKPTNTIKALLNLKNAGFPNLQEVYKSGIRINSVGEAVVYYIKDMYANTFSIKEVQKKRRVI